MLGGCFICRLCCLRHLCRIVTYLVCVVCFMCRVTSIVSSMSVVCVIYFAFVSFFLLLCRLVCYYVFNPTKRNTQRTFFNVGGVVLYVIVPLTSFFVIMFANIIHRIQTTDIDDTQPT